MIARLVDRAVSAISPERGLRRMMMRQHLERAQRNLTQAAAYEAAAIGDSVWNNLRGAPASADALLGAALPLLRDRSRHAFRNNPTARAGVRALEALMVGGGIDIEPDTGDEVTNRTIKQVWDLFVVNLDIAGRMHLWDFQRQDIRMEAQCGSSLWYLIYDPELLTQGVIPVKVMALHPAQLSIVPVVPVPRGNQFRNGVETDRFGKPLAYHITDNPGDYLIIGATTGDSDLTASTNPTGDAIGIAGIKSQPMRMRIPAEFILHSYEQLEPGQAVGEPMLASVISRSHDAGELVATELTSAKMASAPSVVIKSPVTTAQDYGQDSNDANGNPWNFLEAGSIARTLPGEDISVISSTRPSQGIFPFLKGIYGGVAAALRIPSRLLDRDPSQASFSSLGADNIDQERSLEPEAERYGRQKPGALYQAVLPLLCVAARVSFPKDPVARMRFRSYRLVLEKRPYVNRLDDIKASIMAIEAGLSSYEEEYGRLGFNARERLRKWAEEQATPEVKAINARRLAMLGPMKGAAAPTAAAPSGAPAGDAASTDVDNAAANAQSVPDTALNGAQVTALQGLLEDAAGKRLPPATVKAAIAAAFPAIDESEIDAMIAPLLSFTPAAEPAAAGPSANGPESDGPSGETP